MKAISLHRPWCYFIEWEWKTIETREHERFSALAGQRIAIHAALEWDADWYAKVKDFIDLNAQIEKPDGRGKESVYDRIHRPLMGRAGWRAEIVCTAHVDRYERMLTGNDSLAAMIDCGRVMRSGLVLSAIESIRPRVPYVGKLGIFDVFTPENKPEWTYTKLRPAQYDILCNIRDHGAAEHNKASTFKEDAAALFRMGLVDVDRNLTHAGRVTMESYESQL